MLDEMLNFQKATFDKNGLRYDHSLSSCSTSSSALNNVIFVPPASNAKLEITKPKIEIVSEDKYDKGKFILGAPPKIVRKKKLSRTIIVPLIRSLNRRNLTSVIIVEHRDTLVQIAISGLLLNKAIVCHLLEAKINFKTLWLILGNFWRSCCSWQILIGLILLIHLSKSLRKRMPLLPPNLLFGRKNTSLSDSFTYPASLVCFYCFESV